MLADIDGTSLTDIAVEFTRSPADVASISQNFEAVIDRIQKIQPSVEQYIERISHVVLSAVSC